MRIVCVAGGSYKSFYLNNLYHLGKCDLLIFNYDIFYDIVNRLDIKQSPTVNEIIQLATRLNCKVVAGVKIIKDQKRYFKIKKELNKLFSSAANAIRTNVCPRVTYIG